MQQIADWLKKLGMSEYAERFADNKIDTSVLPHLTDQDLCRCEYFIATNHLETAVSSGDAIVRIIPRLARSSSLLEGTSMQANRTRKRALPRGGLAVLCAALALVLDFNVSTAEAAPFVYVTSPADPGTVSVLDAASNTVAATVSVDGAPISVAVTPDGKRAYIAMRKLSGGTVSVLDTATNMVVATVPVTDFFIGGVAITPDGKHAYVANSGNDHTVKVLDTGTNQVAATIPLNLSIDLAFTPNGKHGYVTDFEGVSVIDTATSTVETTITIGKGDTVTVGRGIAITPDGKNAYLTNGGSNTVSVIDTATNTVSATVVVGVDPVGVAVTPDGKRAYVTNHGSSDVSVIDTAANALVATVGVRTAPVGVATTADGKQVYVTNSGSGTVSVIETATNKVVVEVTAGKEPFGIAIIPLPPITR